MQSSKKKITRSRRGCHRCKKLKVKCLEEKPACSNCVRAGEKCDYTLKLTWGGRPYKNAEKRQTFGAVSPGPMQSTPFTAQTINFVTPNQRKARKSNPKPKPVYKSPATKLKEELESDISPVKREQNDEVAPEAKRRKAEKEEMASSPLTFFVANQLSLADGPKFLDGLLNPDPQEKEPEPALGTPPLDPVTPISWDQPVEEDSLEDSYDVDLATIVGSFPSKPRSPYFSTFSSPRTPEFVRDLMRSPMKSPNFMYTDDKEDSDVHIQIPPSLTPLPEILMKVPYYRELLHFWVDVAANNLVPAPSSYKDNPFKIILPQMAMHYPGLLTTILAFAARARQVLGCRDDSQSHIVNQLLGRSCDELMRLLQDKTEATSDGTLATSLLLACYEVCHSNDFEVHRTHTHGASQIMVARTKHTRTSPWGGSPESPELVKPLSVPGSPNIASLSRSESDITFFLVRWFTYVDVVGALSSTRDRDSYLRSYKSKDGYRPVTSIENFDLSDSGDRGKDIDLLLGFDKKLLPHFVNISLLVDEVEKYAVNPNADSSCLPVHLVTAALELRDNFRKAYEAAEAQRESKIGEMLELTDPAQGHNANRRKQVSALMHHGNVLRSTNRLYFDMGLLNLYRRALLLPRSSPLVQDLVAEMTEVLELCVEAGSAADICCIFCNFCAACDTLDNDKREFFVQRFSHLAENGNINAAKSLVIMNRCWDTGEDWITAANSLDIDLVLM